LHRHSFLPCMVIMQPHTTIRDTQNKCEFYKMCKANDLPVPESICADLVLSKPARGSGSRDVVLHEQGRIYSEYLPGKEYTVDVFCTNRCTIRSAVARERVVIKSGVTTTAIVSRPTESMLAICSRLCMVFAVQGAVNIQLREDADGKLKIIEMNARLGGGTCMSLPVVNFAMLYTDAYNVEKGCGKKDPVMLHPFEPFASVRHFDESVHAVDGTENPYPFFRRSVVDDGSSTTTSRQFLGAKRALCLSPHPDDIEYGALGTILNHTGTHFDVFVLTGGGDFDATTSAARARAARPTSP
jgi:hypothetical protein